MLSLVSGDSYFYAPNDVWRYKIAWWIFWILLSELEAKLTNRLKKTRTQKKTNLEQRLVRCKVNKSTYKRSQRWYVHVHYPCKCVYSFTAGHTLNNARRNKHHTNCTHEYCHVAKSVVFCVMFVACKLFLFFINTLLLLLFFVCFSCYLFILFLLNMNKKKTLVSQ